MKNHIRVPPPRPRSGAQSSPLNARQQQLFDQGLKQSNAGDHAAAAETFRQLTGQRPELAPLHFNLARALIKLNRDAEAIPALERVLVLQPGHVKAVGELTMLRRRRGELAAALELAQRLVGLEPGNDQYLNILSTVLTESGRHAEAEKVAQQVLGLKPDVAAYHYNLGNIVRALRGDLAAIPHYTRAIELDPSHARAQASLGAALYRASPEQAEPHFRQALAHDPDNLSALAGVLGIELRRCDFDALDATFQRVVDAVDHGAQKANNWVNAANLSYHALFLPFPARTLRGLQDQIARRLEQEARTHAPPTVPFAGEPPPGGRIRVGYLSPNFGDHPVGHVTLSLFPAHDRARFEVHAFSTRRGGSDGSDYARRHRAAFDGFHDIGHLSASEAAAYIRAAGIQILVDLDGYMDTTSPPILARRPAPVQVFWLGHAGGLGLPFVDYLIADARVIPPGEEDRYREAVARLPDCYHCADRHPVAADCPPRSHWNLPEEAVVYCVFNNPDKIDRQVFDAWLRILGAVQGSVLWLSSFRQNRDALLAHFQAYASRRGIVPERLIMSERIPDKALHLARLARADLMLDTLTLNASTTALDGLWAGLPLLTVRGDRFSNRISNAMLHGLGLDDWVCADLDEYERRAIQLGHDPDARQALRQRLRGALETTPLFDIRRFTHNLERALETMWARHQRGEAPAGFDLPAEV